MDPHGGNLFPFKELFKVWELGEESFCRFLFLFCLVVFFFSCIFFFKKFLMSCEKKKESSESLKRTLFHCGEIVVGLETFSLSFSLQHRGNQSDD